MWTWRGFPGGTAGPAPWTATWAMPPSSGQARQATTPIGGNSSSMTTPSPQSPTRGSIQDQVPLPQIQARLGQTPRFAETGCGPSIRPYAHSHIDERFEPVAAGESGALVRKADQLLDAKDYAAALSLYRAAANAGQERAIRRVGVFYDNGYVVMQDYPEAMRWYRRAADAGDPVAMRNIGSLYLAGQGVPQSYSQALLWFRKAAALGLPSAMHNIGILYDDGGPDIPRDYAEAMRWYLKAVDAGNSLAASNIGAMYTNEEGVAKDQHVAVCWYLKAADQDEPNAIYNIGVLYSRGQGIPQDHSEAMRWFRRAADLGTRQAMYNIGVEYDQGWGVPQSYPEAIRWGSGRTSCNDKCRLSVHHRTRSAEQSRRSHAVVSSSCGSRKVCRWITRKRCGGSARPRIAADMSPKLSISRNSPTVKGIGSFPAQNAESPERAVPTSEQNEQVM